MLFLVCGLVKDGSCNCTGYDRWGGWTGFTTGSGVPVPKGWLVHPAPPRRGLQPPAGHLPTPIGKCRQYITFPRDKGWHAKGVTG